MKKAIRNIAAGILFGLASFLPMKANAQNNKIDASVEIVQSKNNPTSFIRPNLFYKIFGLDGYSFFEFYRNENFFGKTIISKDFGVRAKGVKPTAEIVYGSGFNDSYGLGVNYDVPMPKRAQKRASLNVKALPVWFNNKGYLDDKVMVGYFGSLDLPRGFILSSFGEINVGSKGGPQWGYGEIRFGKKFSNHLSVAYNPLLKNRGKLSPKWEHAISARYTF